MQVKSDEEEIMGLEEEGEGEVDSELQAHETSSASLEEAKKLKEEVSNLRQALAVKTIEISRLLVSPRALMRIAQVLHHHYTLFKNLACMACI